MTLPTTNDFKRIDDLRALWRWCASLDHRLRLARLRLEFIALEADEQEALANEVAEFRLVCARFSEAVYERRFAGRSVVHVPPSDGDWNDVLIGRRP